MKYKFTAPSKTFLVGEYLALEGGPSLVAATEPRFELSIEETQESEVLGIPTLSPASKWIRDHEGDFSGQRIEFMDPHLGKGGFGASTAQFLFVYAWSEFKKHHRLNFENLAEINALWQAYREYARVGDGPVPSGGDLVSQLVGGVSAMRWQDENIESLQVFNWTFEEQSFCLFRTGTKVKTHEHLNDLKEGLEESFKNKLFNAAQKSVKAMEEGDAFNFLISVQEYYKSLNENNLVAPHTQVLVNNFYQSESVIGVKGCGALGADVIFVLSERSKSNNVKALASVVGLELVATSETLSSGLELSMSLSTENKELLHV